MMRGPLIRGHLNISTRDAPQRRRRVGPITAMIIIMIIIQSTMIMILVVSTQTAIANNL